MKTRFKPYSLLYVAIALAQSMFLPGNGQAAESASLSQPCHMDCGACLASSSRTQKRERVLAQEFALRLSSTAIPDWFNYQSLLFSSNVDWKQTSPRGPPADLL